MRHRSGQPISLKKESSSDEEDAFAALSRENKNSKKGNPSHHVVTGGNSFKGQPSLPDQSTSSFARMIKPREEPATLPVSTTSSMKRHHGILSDTRKAKMDALLFELEVEKQKTVQAEAPPPRRFVPDKKGSFVEPGEEHLTTNVFVGNLAPSITEEQITELFRQFGDLYSVKIMWPRTPEERARNRHSGFVCFMDRRSAEEAMDALDETDPFNVGRRVMLRWGKNVKMIVKQGTGGLDVIHIKKKPRLDDFVAVAEKEPVAQLKLEENHASAIPERTIRVLAPKDPSRAQFISTVASYVAKDGSQLEDLIFEREANNPLFAFLLTKDWPSEDVAQEHFYYKWRIFSICQGDTFNKWETQPFYMFQPDGCLWIPPPFDPEAARREEEDAKRKEEDIRRMKEQRRFQNAKKNYSTGRQLEQLRKGAADGGTELSASELDELDILFRKSLCASRESICRAMAFCFEKSACTNQISTILNDLLLETGPAISTETRIARLYLLSDILFNSQQPGVRNAFRYRDSIEKMAPPIFTSFGQASDGAAGRMSRNKIASAVSNVLGAWTSWSVYNPTFIDELHARFEGREVRESQNKSEAEAEGAQTDSMNVDVPGEEKEAFAILSDIPRGDWMTVVKSEGEELLESSFSQDHKDSSILSMSNAAKGNFDDDADGESLADDDADGEPLPDDDADGEPLPDDDADGEPLDDETPKESLKLAVRKPQADDEYMVDDPDGEPLDANPDGEPLDNDDVDGFPLDGEPIHKLPDRQDVDGEPMKEDPDGEPLNA